MKRQAEYPIEEREKQRHKTDIKFAIEKDKDQGEEEAPIPKVEVIPVRGSSSSLIAPRQYKKNQKKQKQVDVSPVMPVPAEGTSTLIPEVNTEPQQDITDTGYPTVPAGMDPTYFYYYYHHQQQQQQQVAAVATGLGEQPNLQPLLSASLAQEKNLKQKKWLRRAGGQTWEDSSLADWPKDDYRIFAGNLGNDVTDEALRVAFSKYHCQRTRVIRDKKTGKTRGYGFVSFSDPDDFLAALREMNGKYICNRPCKLSKSNWDERTFDPKGDKKRKEKSKEPRATRVII